MLAECDAHRPAVARQDAPRQRACAAAGLSPCPRRTATLRVHAETDVEALIEGGLLRRVRADAAAADLVIAVDWESTERSVGRVVEVADVAG